MYIKHREVREKKGLAYPPPEGVGKCFEGQGKSMPVTTKLQITISIITNIYVLQVT